MTVLDKIGAGRATRAVDFDRFRLRRFVDDLALAGELETHASPIELADIAGVLEGNAKAVLFQSAGAERQALVGNVKASRARLARAFGVAPSELLAEILRRLQAKPDIIDVTRGKRRARKSC